MQGWVSAFLLFVPYCTDLYMYISLGEGCSHIAAVLFKVECGAVKLGYTSSTSQMCKWNSTFCSKVRTFIYCSMYN